MKEEEEHGGERQAELPVTVSSFPQGINSSSQMSQRKRSIVIIFTKPTETEGQRILRRGETNRQGIARTVPSYMSPRAKLVAAPRASLTNTLLVRADFSIPTRGNDRSM